MLYEKGSLLMRLPFWYGDKEISVRKYHNMGYDIRRAGTYEVHGFHEYTTLCKT